LANFVFSVKEHSNLRNAFEQRFNIVRPIGHREIEKSIGGVLDYLYNNAKSRLNSDDL
jgi:hypothetical protein